MASTARNRINFVPQIAATNFAFSSFFILLLWYWDTGSLLVSEGFPLDSFLTLLDKKCILLARLDTSGEDGGTVRGGFKSPGSGPPPGEEEEVVDVGPKTWPVSLSPKRCYLVLYLVLGSLGNDTYQGLWFLGKAYAAKLLKLFIHLIIIFFTFCVSLL